MEKTDPFEDYFRNEMGELFAYFEYSPFLAVFGNILNLLLTFVWTYVDLFIMITSVGLSTQFKKINRNLMKHKGQVSRGAPTNIIEVSWIAVRKWINLKLALIKCRHCKRYALTLNNSFTDSIITCYPYQLLLEISSV